MYPSISTARRARHWTILQERVCTDRDNQTTYGFVWDNACGTFITKNIPHGTTGHLRLELSQRTMDENDNLVMEQPVTPKLRLDERPEKITAMYLI